MMVDYNILYTHFILITKNEYFFIEERLRNSVEKYIIGIISNTGESYM